MDQQFNKATPTANSSPMPIAQGQPSAQPSSGAVIALGLIAAKPLVDDFATDIETLSLTKLRKKYSSEASSHMNMLARRKHGALVHEKFLEFKPFLGFMGPVPAPGYTLDRLNSADPEYAPGKVRWASKKEQAVNKQNVILLTATNGVVKPLIEWAADLKIPATTLKSRKAKGWSDAEVLYGKKSKSTVTYAKAPATYRRATAFPWPREFVGDWEKIYRLHKEESGYLETRAAFIVRRLNLYRALMMDELERLMPPDGCDADDLNAPRIDSLYSKLDLARRIIRWARLLTGAAAGPWVERRRPRPRYNRDTEHEWADRDYSDDEDDKDDRGLGSMTDVQKLKYSQDWREDCDD
jgi:hypothetical protein